MAVVIIIYTTYMHMHTHTFKVSLELIKLFLPVTLEKFKNSFLNLSVPSLVRNVLCYVYICIYLYLYLSIYIYIYKFIPKQAPSPQTLLLEQKRF